MKAIRSKASVTGFSSIDLIIVIVTIVLLFVLVVHALLRFGVNRGNRKSPRIHCIANLKQIGLAYRMWANDHGEKFPMDVSTNQGGSREFNESGQVFRHYLAMSNELNTPKLLACRMDSKRTPATSWATLNNQSISYFVGLDAQGCYPQILLSGDRNITGGTITNGNVMLFATNSPAGWTKEIHVQCGNIGLADGSAQQVTEIGLRKQLQANPIGITRLATP